MVESKMKKAAVLGSVYFAAAMSLVIWRCLTKPVALPKQKAVSEGRTEEPQESSVESGAAAPVSSEGGRILLIDPDPRIPGAEDHGLAVAREIARIAGEDGGARVYLTRTEESREDELAQALIKETDADLCLRIVVKEGERGFGTSFNETFYTRRYTNSRFAYDMLLCVHEETGWEPLGLELVGRSDPFLAVSGVPSCILAIGMDDAVAYEDQQRVARGAAAAIEKAWEALGL